MMNIEKISESCGISVAKLKKYRDCGILQDSEEDVSQENIHRLGIWDTLKRAGFTLEEGRNYFADESTAKRVPMLRDKRKNLLESIHKGEHILSRIDDLLWAEQHEKGAKGK